MKNTQEKGKGKRMGEIMDMLLPGQPLLGQDVKLEEGKIFKDEVVGSGYIGSVMKPNSIEDEHIAHVLGVSPKQVQERMERIVKAVNEYDKLKDALQMICNYASQKKFDMDVLRQMAGQGNELLQQEEQH